MRALFNRLPFATQLMVGFGIVAGLMFFSDMLKIVDGARNLAAVEHYFRTEDRIGNLAADSVAALEKARRLEQDVLQRLRAGGNEPATANSARPVVDQLAVVRGMMAEVRSLRPDLPTARRTRAVETSTLLYEHHFLRVVHLHGQSARFAGASRALDSAMPAAPRLQGDALSAYEQVRLEIDNATLEYTAAAREIEPALTQLREQSAAAQDSVRGKLQGATSVPGMLAGLAWLVNLLAAVALAGAMAGRLRHWCRDAARFCGRLAARDWSARMPEAAGNTELGRVAQAMNGMADSLQQGSVQLEQQAVALEKANRALRLLFRCNEGMMRAASEPELLDAVCRQLAGEGAYPQVWIGVPCDDEFTSIRPAAMAMHPSGAHGDTGALRFCWGGAPEQRGLAGEAIVREQTVVARASAGEAGQLDQPGEAGYASGAALPLAWRGEVLGVLVLYSRDPHAFDGDELQLLQDLASDLATRLAGLRDTLRRRLAEQAMDHQSRHDPLTGLPNRSLLGERLQQASIRALRDARQVAVLVLGLDRFRIIGAQHGAETANGLLKHAAQALAAGLRDGDTVARLMGDEFAVVVGGLVSQEDAMTVAAKLMAAVQQPFLVNGMALSTTASVGIGMHLRDGADTATLLCCANAAMVSAQAMGGNRMRYYAPELNERAVRLGALETDLVRALARGELAVHYQPRAMLATGGIVAAEALLRWRHPQWGMVPPCEFMAAAERSGLVIELGRWVMRDVCRQLRTWQDEGRQLPVVAIALTARQFRHGTLEADLRSALSEFGVAPDRLELDVAESTIMHRLDDAIARLHALRAIGVRLSLEDFGAGNSALGRLRELPVQSLKIGQSYVRHVADNPADAAVCGSIITLAHNLALTVVAEGVESAESVQFLREQHCDEIQGQYVAQALPAEDFAGLMARPMVMA
jgi:diguanylate cyclase (GGDEF)-like protein